MFGTNRYRQSVKNKSIQSVNNQDTQEIFEELSDCKYDRMLILLSRDPGVLQLCLNCPKLCERILESQESREKFRTLTATDNEEILTILRHSTIFKNHPDDQNRMFTCIDNYKASMAYFHSTK